MNILIVGCGKVGTALAEILSGEHKVTVIDQNEALVNRAASNSGVKGIIGNGLQTDILEKANISKTNIFIAVTSSDETNILSCLIAKKMKAHHCVARIRSPEFENQLVFMREELGISLMINPDFIAASEIERLLRYPEAINVESFANGRVELAETRVTRGSILENVALNQLSRRMKLDVLICAVQREGELIIPNGNFVLKAGDKIHLTAVHTAMVKFFRSISSLYREKRVRTAVIIGGGHIAYHLSRQLTEIGVKVKIIDENPKRCCELEKALNKVSVICADGTDHDVLKKEKVYDSDAIINTTGTDKENILLSLLAQNNNVNKVVTKLDRPSLIKLSGSLSLDSIISPKDIMINHILQYIRAKQNSLGNSLISLYRLVNNSLEAMEFIVKDYKNYVDVPLKKLKIRSGILIASIVRNNVHIVPRGDDCLKLNDSVVIVTINKGFNNLSDIFN